MLIQDDYSSYMPCEFLISGTGPSILGFKNLEGFGMKLSLLVSKKDSDVLLQDYIEAYAKRNGLMKIQPIQPQVQDDPLYLK